VELNLRAGVRKPGAVVLLGLQPGPGACCVGIFMGRAGYVWARQRADANMHGRVRLQGSFVNVTGKQVRVCDSFATEYALALH